MNRGSTSARMSETAAAGTESRTRPVTSPGWTDTVFSDSSACSTAGPACSSSRCPASVSATLREVRVKSDTPSRASSWRTDWLSAEGDTPSSRAAAAKLRRRATSSQAFSELRGVKAIVKVFYTKPAPGTTSLRRVRCGLVVLVADLLHPVDGLAVEHFHERDVRHGR